MALTKGSQTTLDEWALTPSGALTETSAVRLGTELDVSTAYYCKLDIKAAIGEATVASTGQPEIIIQTTGEASPAKDDWITYARVIGPTGTAVGRALSGTAAAAATDIPIDAPVTNNVDNVAKFKFIKNTTAANSEIVYQIATSADATDLVYILGGLANEQTAAASTLMDIDSATQEVVMQWSFDINCTNMSRIRIIYNAHYDLDGPDVYCYSAYTLNTGL